MNTQPTHPKASHTTRNNSTGIMTDRLATLRRSLISTALSTALAATLATAAFANNPTLGHTDPITVEPGTAIRLHTASDDAAFEIDVPQAGILTLDAVATGPELASGILLLASGADWNAELVTPLERSDSQLAVAVYGPARLTFRVVSQSPQRTEVKVLTDFTPATVIQDILAADLDDHHNTETHIVRHRFIQLDDTLVTTDKGDPEPIDPDPGQSSGFAATGRLLAEVATTTNSAAALKGDPEPIDPDPGVRADGSVLRSRVLFYQPICGTVATSDDHGDSTACATNLRPGRLVPGEIAGPYGDDLDVFSFDLSEAARVEITTTGATDTFAELLDQAGRVLATDDDSGDARNAVLARLLPAGRYTVRIRGAAGAEGPYGVALTTDRL